MTNQITIDRTNIDLDPLDLNDPEKGFYLSNEYSPSNTIWQRYEAASSPFVNGERIIAQKKTNDDTIFTMHLKLPEEDKNLVYQERFLELQQAFAQPRFTFTVTIEGITETHYAAGAAEMEKVFDFTLMKAGWLSFIISIPTRPYITNTGE